MGIQRLLATIKSIHNPIHVSSYKGKKAAIDGYAWLHKGVYCCSKELCLNQPTEKFVSYFINKLQMLQYHGITPVLIFDGDKLPMKKDTEEERHRSREENLAKGLLLMEEGRLAEADECFKKAVDVTPHMAFRVIEAARALGIESIVAPYEADAQLAFLERSGYVDFVISEDSDMIPFGVGLMFFKMNNYGDGVEVRLDRLPFATELSFASFTPDMIRWMCILTGCDYLASLPGIGIKKAHKLVKENRTVERILQRLRMEGNIPPADYAENFRKACLTFCHQRVWDPVSQQIVHLNPLPDDLVSSELSFLGPPLDPEEARLICTGEIDPFTRTPFHVPPVSSPEIVAAPVESSGRMKALSAQQNSQSFYNITATISTKKAFAPPRSSFVTGPMPSTSTGGTLPLPRPLGQSPAPRFESPLIASSKSRFSLGGGTASTSPSPWLAAPPTKATPTPTPTAFSSSSPLVGAQLQQSPAGSFVSSFSGMCRTPFSAAKRSKLSQFKENSSEETDTQSPSSLFEDSTPASTPSSFTTKTSASKTNIGFYSFLDSPQISGDGSDDRPENENEKEKEGEELETESGEGAAVWLSRVPETKPKPRKLRAGLPRPQKKQTQTQTQDKSQQPTVDRYFISQKHALQTSARKRKAESSEESGGSEEQWDQPLSNSSLSSFSIGTIESSSSLPLAEDSTFDFACNSQTSQEFYGSAGCTIVMDLFVEEEPQECE